EALKALREADRLQPADATIKTMLAGALDFSGDERGAVAAYEAALRIDPRLVGALNNYADLLTHAKTPGVHDPRRAVELAERAVKLAPETEMIWATLGCARYRCGQYALAADALARSVKSPGGDVKPDTALMLAMCHWKLGDREKARELYRK